MIIHEKKSKSKSIKRGIDELISEDELLKKIKSKKKVVKAGLPNCTRPSSWPHCSY